MKTILSIKDYATALEGLEKIEAIDILEDNKIIIVYTLRDDYMKENELCYKQRVLQIDTNQTEEYKRVQDYANPLQ